MKMREDEFLKQLKERYHHIFKDGHDALDIARHVLMILRADYTEWNDDIPLEKSMVDVLLYIDNFKFRYEE